MNRINLSPSRLTIRLGFSLLLSVISIVGGSSTSAEAQEKPGEKAEEEAAAESKEVLPADATKEPLTGKDGIDLLCEVDIFFTWRRTEQPTKDKPAPEPGPLQEVYFTTVGERGLVAEDLKNRLASRIPAIQNQALTACRKTYQDQAQCVATSLRSHAQDYNMMDFRARDALLNAIEQNCAANTGICVSTRATEPKCYLNRPPNKPKAPPKAPAGEAPAKDDKKKKK